MKRAERAETNRATGTGKKGKERTGYRTSPLAQDLLEPGLKLLFLRLQSLAPIRPHPAHHYGPTPATGSGASCSPPASRIALYAPEEGRKAPEPRHRLHQPVFPTHPPGRRARQKKRSGPGTGELRAPPRRLENPEPSPTPASGVYKWFRATSKVSWGVQEESAVPGVGRRRRALAFRAQPDDVRGAGRSLQSARASDGVTPPGPP